MILLKVRNQLQAAGEIAVRDLAAQLNISKQETTLLLDHWVKKGLAQKLPAGSSCKGSCRSCSPDTIEIYQWIKKPSSQTL